MGWLVDAMVGVDGDQLHIRPGAVDHHHQQQLGRQPHQDGHQLWAHRLPHGHRLLAHPHCLVVQAATSRRKRTDSKAIELKYVQPTTAISLFNQEQQKHQSQKKKTSQYLSCVQPEANVFYKFHQGNKKPQIYSHIKAESKIFHNGADTQDWLREIKEPNQRICSSVQGQVYTMKQYLSKQKTGNLCIIL